MGLCAALGAVALAAPVADANAIVVTVNTTVAVPNNFDGVYINFLTGATGTSGGTTAGWDFNAYNSGTALSFFWNQAVANTSGGVAAVAAGPYSDLPGGSVISSASTFILLTATAATAPFKPVGTHTLGFRFYNETTSSINYGYLTYVSQATIGLPAQITGWSYENSGGAITTPIPEPATGALMALGALGLGAMKLRRQRRQAAA